MESIKNLNFVDIAKEVIELEISELEKMKNRIGNEFVDAVDLIFNTSGRVVITGIGKSGIIGKKIAASLASTGTQSFFMNAAEGLHGDLGMVYKDDIVIAISNSGSSQEVLNLIPSIKQIGSKLIAMTGNVNSPLAKASDVVLNIGIDKEACPLNLAPTSSTTATLVMGDALTVALIKKRDFKPESFAVYHPGGALGRRLLTRVRDLMHTEIPKVDYDANIQDIIYEISSKRLGLTLVYSDTKVVGIITDGDIRRVIGKLKDLSSVTANEIMSPKYKHILESEMANVALEYMDSNKISNLVVHDANDEVKGIITLHDVFGFK
ncbi:MULTISPECIES: KpsF/GutQ family sugar-phosphate isomerase [Exiguobacterium]|uniref:KpsF/GutQ family sugar-phosphate isomerase n=1 Tax=Exiguobacterium TaxID=33986 RepID=UPI001BE97925|nr:KpsF/GutQ family sugar-phosphate isomerase [Exiguobacterium aestuarii]MCA0981096.1 KpsF/GutQ family sugar-phosphate isomerase [Exiguobacterium aestuarii]